MPKLYFRYGAMCSGKTMNMLIVADNYKKEMKKVILIKPDIDTRYGKNIIKSRTGLEQPADYVIKPYDDIKSLLSTSDLEASCMLVDEVQFFTCKQINQLRTLSYYFPVICYGLRTDYKSHLFRGSKRLMEIADSIKEIKTICYYCKRKAIINMKFIELNGIKKPIKDGNSTPDIGAEDKYIAVCWNCWNIYL